VARYESISFDSAEYTSGNEIHQVNHELKALSASMAIALQSLSKRP
jgi:hypothetical protein